MFSKLIAYVLSFHLATLFKCEADVNQTTSPLGLLSPTEVFQGLRLQFSLERLAADKLVSFVCQASALLLNGPSPFMCDL